MSARAAATATAAPADGSGNPLAAMGEGTGRQAEGPDDPAPPTTVPEEAPTAGVGSLESLLGPSWQLDLADMVFDEALQRHVIEAEGGVRVVLTLDPTLQSHMQEVVGRYDEPAEALVALDPASGRVLAWVEDANETAGIEHPAASSEPWAASLFKIVSAAALIQEANLGLARRMCVPPGRGEFEAEDLVSNAERDTRCVDLVEAMAQSVNLYFGRLVADHLSPQVVSDWLERFGFNQPIPFEISVAPSLAEVPESALGRARLGAGFRHSRLSPLHAALISAAVANAGQMMRPTLVAQVLDPSGATLYEHQPLPWRRVMRATTARTLATVLSQTTVSGTAARYFAERAGWPADLRVAGKTGTLSNRQAGEAEPNRLLIYSWFTGFAPLEGPSLAVAGLVYNAERWYIKGSYLASEAIIRYLRH